MKKVIETSNAPAPIGPYNQAIVVNDTIYVSGQIALDTQSGELITNDIVEETNKVMSNLSAILEEGGFDLNDVVKCSIFVKDMGQFAIINEAYGSYFKSVAPARETVEVARLPKDVNVEISCIAVK